ncbi:hypothetical protein AJ80_07363 [Polytolypa hystricis UAMH7299]|uniref:Fungal lipase-type domain-containing protein n=1 Tax=Polytolypa hystricis (strain UAMH7299) TaxID=1447883 RepID=A0A2B7XQ91_POLH7|nr:hypothetical protein AJ80_07363 [Polytolypa hystricis UAMH7299]
MSPRPLLPWLSLLAAYLFLGVASCLQHPIVKHNDGGGPRRNVSSELFSSLEELARIVDITYCVGTTGVYKPFLCAGRCPEFEGFELVKTWNTGPLLSDSCGFLVLSHPPWPKRIILGFRGTYSITNTIIDLSAVPQTYVPYPDPNADPENPNDDGVCNNCTVHAGFMISWISARSAILPALLDARAKYPDYQLVLVGHSLGGAVAALAGLEFQIRGWKPQVTTFGEPRVGNRGLAEYIDARFGLTQSQQQQQYSSYHRVTHAKDPIPLLPLSEWGYAMHAGEIYISKPDLPPSIEDLHHCVGTADPTCIAGAEDEEEEEGIGREVQRLGAVLLEQQQQQQQGQQQVSPSRGVSGDGEYQPNNQRRLFWPGRMQLWELFFAHRDYFYRLGICMPGGDPSRWRLPWPWG